MSEFELQKIAELEKEIEKWRQQQKEDYATYLQKVEELQKTIVDSEVIFERNNAFTHKRILELEDKIENANNIIEVWEADPTYLAFAMKSFVSELKKCLSQEQKKEGKT